MRISGIVFVLFVVLSLASSVSAQPLEGAYDSQDLGGQVFVGRYTEGWDAGGGALNAGTVLNAESWDAGTTTLGSQWRYWCSTEGANAVLLINTVNGLGNGNRTYMKTFNGGYIWLSGSGPWANGAPEYYGTIDNYVEFETITYSNWVPIAAVTNVQAQAHFDDYPATCMTFYIGNGSRVATTALGDPVPANYPEFLDTSCSPTRSEGACWDFFTITLSVVGCVTAAEETSWGAVKSMYTE
ncbi:MAG: hypothetical protein MUF59_09000 [Candidatus Krumholzibacteria bacterium]|jgi:hypothetical protein|nr:hypothetical protein [Candidatus Krumholzibacteria bacterium]